MTQPSRHDTDRLNASPRCGAKTRSGKSCRAPAVSGKARCRMHGGASGSGAPKGNTNALKHGYYSAEAKEMRRLIGNLSRKTREIIDDM